LSFRTSKLLLVLAAALHWSLVVLNNLVDHPTNLHHVQHVLSMDTVEEANRGSWRAIHDPTLQHALYWLVILTEAAAMTLLWLGGVRLAAALKSTSEAFAAAKERAIQGLTLVLRVVYDVAIRQFERSELGRSAFCHTRTHLALGGPAGFGLRVAPDAEFAETNSAQVVSATTRGPRSGTAYSSMGKKKSRKALFFSGRS